MSLPYRIGPIATASLNTFGVYLVQVAIKLTLLVLVAKYLGPSNFGNFVALTALAIALGALSTFGLGYLVLRDAVISRNKGKAVLASIIPATTLSSALLFPIYIWLSRNILGSDTSTVLLLLIGLTEFIFAPIIIAYSQKLQGMHRAAQSQGLILLPHLFRVVGIATILFIFPSQSYEIYILVYFLSSVATLPFALAMTGSFRDFLSLKIPGLAQLARAFPYALMRFTSIAPMEADKALAMRLLSQEEAGIYSLAARGFSMAAVPITAVVVSATPRVIEEAQIDSSALKSILHRILALAGILGLLAASAMALVLAPLAQYMMGPDFAGIHATLQLLALAAPFMAIRVAAGGLLIPLDKPLLRSHIEFAGLATLIGLSFFLVNLFGTAGLIMAVIICEMLMALALFWHLFNLKGVRMNLR